MRATPDTTDTKNATSWKTPRRAGLAGRVRRGHRGNRSSPGAASSTGTGGPGVGRTRWAPTGRGAIVVRSMNRCSRRVPTASTWARPGPSRVTPAGRCGFHDLGQGMVHFHMELEGVDPVTPPEGLMGEEAGAGQVDSPVRQGEGVAVPVHTRQRGVGQSPVLRTEDRIAAAGLGQLHLAQADLLGRAGGHLGAQRRGQLLGPQAYAEHRSAGGRPRRRSAPARPPATDTGRCRGPPWGLPSPPGRRWTRGRAGDRPGPCGTPRGAGRGGPRSPPSSPDLRTRRAG